MLCHLMGPGLCMPVASVMLKVEALYAEHQSCREMEDYVC